MAEEFNQRKIGIILGLSIVGIVFIWVIVSISSLVAQSKLVYIRNPYDQEMKIQVGEDTYKLIPRSSKEINIEEGKIRIKSSVSGKTIVDTSVYISSDFADAGGFINVSGQPMYLWYEMYGSPGLESIYKLGDSSSIAGSPIMQQISQTYEYYKIDSVTLYGNMKEFPKNQILIKKEWDYDISDSFESEVSASSSTGVAIGESRSKIFDKNGMLKYWELNYGEVSRQMQLMRAIEPINLESDTIN